MSEYKEATPKQPNISKKQMVKKIAQGFYDLDCDGVKLGAWLVEHESLEGWQDKLTFKHTRDSDKEYEKEISSDGIHHAAEQAYKWWTEDAWEIGNTI